MENKCEDSFFDCRSEPESEPEYVQLPKTVIHKTDSNYQLTKRSNRLPNFDDPREIRAVLERAANTTSILLRGFGGKCDSEPCHSRFYPATLEISARLHTSKSCACPPQCQCRLRGDPVTLKLPMELNPLNGQVKVNIFQAKPKQLGLSCKGEGAGDNWRGSSPTPGKDPAAGLGSAPARRHTQRRAGVRKSERRVRWPDVHFE